MNPRLLTEGKDRSLATTKTPHTYTHVQVSNGWSVPKSLNTNLCKDSISPVFCQPEYLCIGKCPKKYIYKTQLAIMEEAFRGSRQMKTDCEYFREQFSLMLSLICPSRYQLIFFSVCAFSYHQWMMSTTLNLNFSEPFMLLAMTCIAVSFCP